MAALFPGANAESMGVDKVEYLRVAFAWKQPTTPANTLNQLGSGWRFLIRYDG